MGDSQHTQNIRINKVINKNEKCIFYFTEKTKWTFWPTPYILLYDIFQVLRSEVFLYVEMWRGPQYFVGGKARYKTTYCASIYCASQYVACFINWRQDPPPAKRLWHTLLQYAHYCGSTRWSGNEPTVSLRFASIRCPIFAQ